MLLPLLFDHQNITRHTWLYIVCFKSYQLVAMKIQYIINVLLIVKYNLWDSSSRL